MLKRIINLTLSISILSSLHPLNVTNVQSTENRGVLLELQVDFQADVSVSDWVFGFYSYQCLNTCTSCSTQLNPSIAIQIVDQAAPGSPMNMQFVPKSMENPRVFGDGTAAVFAPNSSFPLTAGHRYTFTVQNTTVAAPYNVSTVAQNFFIYDTAHNLFDNGIAPVTAYGDDINTLTNIGGYNYAAVQEEIQIHIAENWNTSVPLAPGQLADLYHLVPAPQSISLLNGRATSLLRKRSVSLYTDFPANQTLQNYLTADLGVRVILVSAPSHADIAIVQNSSVNHPEGYTLNIQNNHIQIEASTDTGAFYAFQTLRQFWYQTLLLPAISIQDAPRFAYRGVLLDTARHFFSVDQMKVLIDAMAAQKLNTLHIHFSDDEGFRLAISSLLTTILDDAQLRGFVDGSTNVPAVFTQANLDKTNYVGNQPSLDPANLIVSSYPEANTAYQLIFSPQDLRTVVAYANLNKITVIPEIDSPGHACALVQADPAVFVDPNDMTEYLSIQGYYNDLLPVCLYDNDAVNINAFTNAMNNIISAISDLFANQTTLYYQNEVSIGADEVTQDAWTSDSSCSSSPWSGLSALSKSHYFAKLLAMANPSVKFSGFQQLVQNNDTTIDPNSMSSAYTAHIWVWEPTATGISQAAALASSEYNYPIVLSFADYLYFDLTYTPDAWEPGYAWAGAFLDTNAALKGSLQADSVLSRLTAEEQENVLGMEGALWSENLVNFRHFAYMALPKLTGLAEAAWSNQVVVLDQVNWQSLATRLGTGNEGFLGYLNAITGLEYRGYPNGISLEIPNSP
ncbi:MAG: family 20 glycosylhydrolase [Chlamydiales bacterium]